MRIRFAFDPFGPFCSWLMAVGAAFSLYCFIVCQAAADPAAWQHHGIYQKRIGRSRSLPITPSGNSTTTVFPPNSWSIRGGTEPLGSGNARGEDPYSPRDPV